MNTIFELATKISSGWSLSAFAIAGILFIVRLSTQKPQARKLMGIGMVVILVLALVPVLLSFYFKTAYAISNSLYRIRVTVLDNKQLPTEEARVWSTQGGETQKVAGGWEIDIPVATLPQNAQVAIYAEMPDAFLKGHITLSLQNDRNLVCTIAMQKDTQSVVRGNTQDSKGRALAGVLVYITGHGHEAVTTDSTGNFVLPAHAPAGQQVLLHAEKPGYEAVNWWLAAGRDDVVVAIKTIKLNHK